jgi:hypothetical protein
MATFNITHTQFNYLEMSYSGVAIPASIAAGIFLHKLGSWRSLTFFITLSVLGLCVFSYAVVDDDNF